MPMPSRPIPELARDLKAQDLERLLANAHFPADRKQVTSYARDHLASADTLAVLDSIPDRVYHSPGDVIGAIDELR